MNYIWESIIIWGIIVFVTIILSIIWYNYLKQVARFENRKKEIAWSSIMICLIVANFMFLPILFRGYDMTEICAQISEYLESVQENETIISFPPFVFKFIKVIGLMTNKLSNFILFKLPIIFTVLLVVIIILITLKTREQKVKNKEEYTRKHLFEFNDKIIESINRKRKR